MEERESRRVENKKCFYSYTLLLFYSKMPDLYLSNQPKTPSKPRGPTPPVFSGPAVTERTKVSNAVRDFLPPKRGHSLSATLILPPDGIRFETQDPEEKILMMLRAHWITNIPWVIMSIILILAPGVLSSFPLLTSFPLKFRLIFVIIWYLVALMYVFEKFLSWFFNLSIITDERIVDVDFINLTTKKVSDCDLDKIQDVSFTNSGAFGTIFNYGNVTVQTAAELVEFVFDNVPDPAKVADVLQHLRTEEKVEAIEGRIR